MWVVLLCGSLFITPPLIWLIILSHTTGKERIKFVKNTFKKTITYCYLIFATIFLYILYISSLLK